MLLGHRVSSQAISLIVHAATMRTLLAMGTMMHAWRFFSFFSVFHSGAMFGLLSVILSGPQSIGGGRNISSDSLSDVPGAISIALKLSTY
jgi:hypothetical protein